MKKFLPALGPIALVLIWALALRLKLVDQFFLPSPSDTFVELAALVRTGVITTDAWATTLRTLAALGGAVSIGLPLGLLLGRAEKLYRSVEFLIDFFRSTPATAIFPLFLLLFGVGDASKVIVAGFGALLIILFNTSYGVIQSKKQRILTAKLMGASHWQIFRLIVFWESLPQTLTGLRNAASLALVIIVVTEMFIGTDIGLGRRIIDSQIVYNIPAMYAAIIATGLIGYSMNAILLLLEKKFAHWSAK